MNFNLLDKNDLITLEEKVDKILLLLEDKQNKQNSDWLRSSEVKKLLHISDATLKNYRDSGKLMSSKVGGIYYYSLQSISDALNNLQNRTQNG